MKLTNTIPASENHAGLYALTGTISDKCPVCGGPRGEITKGFSYDGSRRLVVDMWRNPCGHVDKYSKVRQEIEPIKIRIQ
jgi:hypothetical protein